MSRGGGGSGGENPGKDVRRWRRVPQAVLSDGGRSGHERERESECDVWAGRAGCRRAAMGGKSPNFHRPPTSRQKLM
jgi:hypothetical protein